ncbi:membrane protein [Psychromicrobium silvestre]|uniref:Membrane protein n=1 Tax=Psychromicrobium silvestre TaxID=1645614 RepID=A0A7Y9S8H9_9MICC|nr:YihY/virulence factor BrkB family protein [Psychromicrobium silvestre]NYE96470.1 membrane protein [Psychromicrobium silvestre]
MSTTTTASGSYRRSYALVAVRKKKARQAQAADTAAPAPQDRIELERRLLLATVKLGKARREAKGFFPVLLTRIGLLQAKANLLRPVRALQLYSLRHGPLMAAGSAYNMFFSVAAMLVAGFSIFGLVAADNKDLQDFVVQTVAKSTPGLIDTGQGGLAKPDDLFGSGGGFGITLIVSLLTLLFTSLGWISGLREGIRGVFGLEAAQANPVLRILKDAATLIGLGVALLLTSAIGLGAATVLQGLLGLIGLDSFAAAGWLLSTVVALLLDFVVAIVLFRVASQVEMPRATLWQTALIAAVGSTLLRCLSGFLLANVARNPLLAPFSVILGLFVWFYLLSQVYLIAAGWGAVRVEDQKPTQRRRA